MQVWHQIIMVWVYFHANFGPVIRSTYWLNRGDQKDAAQACDYAAHCTDYPRYIYLYPVNEPDGRKRAENDLTAWYKKRHGVEWREDVSLARGPWG